MDKPIGTTMPRFTAADVSCVFCCGQGAGLCPRLAGSPRRCHPVMSEFSGPDPEDSDYHDSVGCAEVICQDINHCLTV